MSAQGSPLQIVALGAATPLGRDAWASAAAVRASISGFSEHPYAVDSAGKPIRMAIAPWLDGECEGQDRFEALLFPAIEHALESIDPGRLKMALALALPAPRPGLPEALEQRLGASLLKRFPERFSAIGMFAAGHAGGLIGLNAAMKRTADGSFDACLVAGVESYMEPQTLEWLEECDQLHSAGALNNAWGFIPGEAAGAVLMATPDACSRMGAESLGAILRVGESFEPNRIKTETVCIGTGLTAAFREALSALPAGRSVSDVYCDMNGEPYRADEFGFACLRTKTSFASASDFVAPADCWGDVSAASVPLALVQAAIASQKGYANGSHAFVWASSEGGERGAALVELPSSL